MKEKTKKATFNLHTTVLAELEMATSQGAAPSKNAFVERALLKELKEFQRQARLASWQQGASDPALMKDIADVETAFNSADAKTAGGI